jgi:hypothetical protein
MRVLEYSDLDTSRVRPQRGVRQMAEMGLERYVDARELIDDALAGCVERYPLSQPIQRLAQGGPR